MHEYKKLTHPLLSFYFPNNYIYYNNTELNVLGIKVLINQTEISHIYEITEIIVNSYLAFYESSSTSKNNYEGNISEKIKKQDVYNINNINEWLYEQEQKSNENKRNNRNSRNSRNSNSNVNKIRNNKVTEIKNISQNIIERNHQYNRNIIRSANNVISDNGGNVCYTRKIEDRKDERRVNDNFIINNSTKEYSGNTGYTRNIEYGKDDRRVNDNFIIKNTNNSTKDICHKRKIENINDEQGLNDNFIKKKEKKMVTSCIKASEYPDDSYNYSKIMRLCKLNESEFPEFMIEKQNNVFICKADFLNNEFTSKYHYEKNMAREESCEMMINFIENNHEDLNTSMKNGDTSHIKW